MSKDTTCPVRVTPVHPHFPAAVLLACCCASGAAVVQAQARHGTSGTGTRDDHALSDAIAGPLVEALSDQFGGAGVHMRLESIAVAPLDPGNSEIRGTGLVRIDERSGWVGFRFLMPYDDRRRRASFPEVSLGGVAAGERQVPNDPGVVQVLESDVTAALAREFRKPSASLRLDRIATVEAGRRFLRIDAVGVAYLDRETPATPLTIQALMDRESGAWLRLDYGVGHGPGAGGLPSLAIH